MKREEIKKLDKLWTEKVKENAGYQSELSGKPGKQINKTCGVILNSHHFIGRRNMALRWWIPNGVCLTVGEHTMGVFSAHENPEWFRDQMLDIRGTKWLKELKQRNNRIFKGSYWQVLDYLQGKREDYL